MGEKAKRSIKAIIKNKLESVLNYFVPEAEDASDPFKLKGKDVEHLIYDLKNSKINILSCINGIMLAQSDYALQKARFEYNSHLCSDLLQSNSALYKSVSEEMERCPKHKKMIGLTQKEKDYLDYKRLLESKLSSLENAERDLNNTIAELQKLKEGLETQKKRYLTIVELLSQKGENVYLYQKDYEKMTSNIFAYQNSKHNAFEKKAQKESAEQNLQQ